MPRKEVTRRRGNMVSRSNRNTRWLPEKGQRIPLMGTKIPQLSRVSVSERTGFVIVMVFIVLLFIVVFA